jgi:MT0933-like antitoxin protein
MGLFDKAKDAAGEHGDQIQGGVEQGGDFVDEKTGGEHADKVDQAQQFASDQLGGGGEEQQQ